MKKISVFLRLRSLAFAVIIFVLASLTASFPASSQAASQPGIAVDQFFFEKAAREYEALNSVEIGLILSTAGRVAEALEKQNWPSFFSQCLNASDSGSDPVRDEVRRIWSEQFSPGKYRMAGKRVQIVDSRAVVYFDSGTNSVSIAPMYFVKGPLGWRLDSDFILGHVITRAGEPFGRDDNAFEVEQNWLLAQYEDFAGIQALFPRKYVSPDDSAVAAKVRDMVSNNPQNAAALFYLSQIYVKMRYLKESYKVIQQCRAMAPGNIFVELDHSRKLLQRKLGWLITDGLFMLVAKNPYNPQALLVLGETANARYRYDVSIEAFAMAKKLYKYIQPHYHFVYAGSLEQVKNYSLAAEEYAMCAAYGPDYFYGHYLAGKMFSHSGDRDRAAMEFEAAFDSLVTAETKREVSAWLMEYYLQKGNLDEYYTYRRHYFISFVNSPFFIFLLLVLWLFYLMRRFWIRLALVLTLPAYCAIVGGARVYRFAFESLCAYGRDEMAMKLFKKRLAALKNCMGADYFSPAAGEYAQDLLWLADRMMKNFRAPEAQALFTEALEVLPGDPAALLGLGICEYDRKNFDLAIEYLKHGVEAEPENHLFYYYIGLSHLLAGRRQEGIENVMAAYKIDNSFEQALTICEGFFLNGGLVNELVSFLDDVTVLGDVKENFMDRALRLHISRMDYGRMRKLLALYPRTAISSPETYVTIGCAFRECGMYEEAQAAFLKSLSAAKGFASSGASPAAKFFGVTRAALAVFNPFRRRHSPEASQYLELGITCLRMGREDQASRYFRKSQRCDPEYPFIYFFLKDYQSAFEKLSGQISENDFPWNNASIVEAICLCLKEIKNDHQLLKYREWGAYYANTFPDEFGIFSYKYLRHVSKAKYLDIINDRDRDAVNVSAMAQGG